MSSEPITSRRAVLAFPRTLAYQIDEQYTASRLVVNIMLFGEPLEIRLWYFTASNKFYKKGNLEACFTVECLACGSVVVGTCSAPDCLMGTRSLTLQWDSLKEIFSLQQQASFVEHLMEPLTRAELDPLVLAAIGDTVAGLVIDLCSDLLTSCDRAGEFTKEDVAISLDSLRDRALDLQQQLLWMGEI